MKKKAFRKSLKRFINNNRKLFVFYLFFASICMLVIAAAIPIFPSKATKEETINFSNQTVTDGGIELNETRIAQEGANGKKLVTYKASRSLFNVIFGGSTVSKQVVTSKVTQEPRNKIVANGARKYQYMYCSDGSYRYYTDEQFKDAKTGFTHKSKDNCAESGKGSMTQLADAAPGSNTTTISSPRYTPYISPNCTKIPIPYETSYQNVSYLSAGQTQSAGGIDGYRVTCSADSTGYKPADYTISPYNKTVYVGTGSTSNSYSTDSTNAAARQKCISDYNAAKVKIGMAGAGNSSAMDQLNLLYAQCLRAAGY